jgi:hypothetical protein
VPLGNHGGDRLGDDAGEDAGENLDHGDHRAKLAGTSGQFEADEAGADEDDLHAGREARAKRRGIGEVAQVGDVRDLAPVVAETARGRAGGQ